MIELETIGYSMRSPPAATVRVLSNVEAMRTIPNSLDPSARKQVQLGDSLHKSGVAVFEPGLVGAQGVPAFYKLTKNLYGQVGSIFVKDTSSLFFEMKADYYYEVVVSAGLFKKQTKKQPASVYLLAKFPYTIDQLLKLERKGTVLTFTYSLKGIPEHGAKVDERYILSFSFDGHETKLFVEQFVDWLRSRGKKLHQLVDDQFKPGAAPRPSVPTAEPPPLPPPPPPPPAYTCPTCGRELSYIEEYQAWYCYTCQRYV